MAPIGRPPVGKSRFYDFMVKAVPLGAPHRGKNVAGQFECLPVVISFELSLSPQRVSTKGQGAFRAQLTNRGDSQIALELSGTDPEEACAYRFRSRRVSLKAGESHQVPLVVAPRKKPPRGNTTSYDFTIKAAPADAPHLAQTTAGQLEVLRPKRRWGCVFLLALLAIVPILVLCLFSSGIPGEKMGACLTMGSECLAETGGNLGECMGYVIECMTW